MVWITVAKCFCVRMDSTFTCSPRGRKPIYCTNSPIQFKIAAHLRTFQRNLRILASNSLPKI